jgi:hypothetical protein
MDKILREFATSSDKVVNRDLRLGIWEGFDNPRLVRGRAGRGAGQRYIKVDIGDEGRVYRPLVDTPALFLEFAMLADDPGLDAETDTERNAGVYLDWVHSYGTLGLEPAPAVWHNRRGVSTHGGPEDTLESFVREAWIANQTLRLYEAAMADPLDLGTIRSHAERYYPSHKALFFTRPHPGESNVSTRERAKEFAMREVAAAVQGKVAWNVYPALYQRKDGNFEQGWDFVNLLGAMWLQMFWLMTDPEKIRLCKLPGCDRFVYHDEREDLPEDPGLKKNVRRPYKTRKDKLYCTEDHRKKYHYLTVVKPRRQAQRARRADDN